MASADWRSRIHQELRRHRPRAVIVTLDDGGDEVKTFKPSGSERGMWSRLLESLPSEWTRIEMQDKEGNTLWMQDAPREPGAAAGALQLGKAAGSNVDQVTALVNVMLRAQDVALSRQQDAISRLIAGYEKIVEVSTSRLTALENLVGNVLQTAYDATLQTAEAHAVMASAQNAGEESGSSKMLAEFLGVKLGVRKPNGARVHRPAGPTPPKQPPQE